MSNCLTDDDVAMGVRSLALWVMERPYHHRLANGKSERRQITPKRSEKTLFRPLHCVVSWLATTRCF